MAAAINFSLTKQFDVSAQVLWDELVDWKGHAHWVPMTRVEVEPGDPQAIGAVFTAWTGPGPLAVEDRMRVAELAWDAASASGSCRVEKLGPVFRGSAGFTVTSLGERRSQMVWQEELTVGRAPSFASLPLRIAGQAGFRVGMWRLARHLARR